MAKKHGYDPKLHYALIQHESGWNPKAVSGVGAKGLGQIMPLHYRPCGMSNPFNWKQNMTCSAGILADALKSSHGNITKALVLYNGGWDAWNAWRKGSPFDESVGYVRSILAIYNRL